jgi:hypothetical protein
MARIEEPFIKAHLALGLVARGARTLRISIDGKEHRPENFRQILIRAGYSHEHDPRSKAIWTGVYGKDQAQILVVSKPGADLDATFDDGRRFMAECKGEVTRSGIRSGGDLTAFYNALGQLVRHTGETLPPPDERALVVPNTDRLRQIARSISQNSLVRHLKIAIILMDAHGNILTM